MPTPCVFLEAYLNRAEAFAELGNTNKGSC